METVVSRKERQDPLEEYARWNSLDVNENANRYMGPTGFFSYLLEEYMKKNNTKKVLKYNEKTIDNAANSIEKTKTVKKGKR